VLCRLRWDPRARDYAARRTTQGLSRPETIRCLKRYLAREVYTALLNPDLPHSPSCFAFLLEFAGGVARVRRSWRRAGDGQVRDLGV
jgi:hypothetical protein